MSSLILHELIEDILSRLPVKSLLRFRCVSKSWLDLIRNPRFIKMHLKRAIENQNFTIMSNDNIRVYSIDYHAVLDVDEVVEIDYPLKAADNEIRIWGSCDGLISFASVEDSGNEFNCIWNPSTKEYKRLPVAPLGSFSTEGNEFCFTISGFGYDLAHDYYKCVQIWILELEDDNSSCRSEVMVYTLGSNSWRNIGTIPYDLTYELLPGIYVNGALHWGAWIPNRNDKVLLSLDLGDEEWREVPQPNYSDNDFDLNVGVLDGCLCAICNMHNAGVDVWMMKEYGVRGSWVKLFTIARRTYIEYFNEVRLIKIEKNGEILLNDDNKMSISYYDPTSGRIRVLGIHGFLEPYVRSLVSLNSATYVGQA